MKPLRDVRSTISPTHIQHAFSKELAIPTETVILPIINESEAQTQGMVRTMEAILTYT